MQQAHFPISPPIFYLFSLLTVYSAFPIPSGSGAFCNHLVLSKSQSRTEQPTRTGAAGELPFFIYCISPTPLVASISAK